MEELRIREARRSFLQWCLKHIPVHRGVTKEDVKSIERVRESNLKSREALFGHTNMRWYS